MTNQELFNIMERAIAATFDAVEIKIDRKSPLRYSDVTDEDHGNGLYRICSSTTSAAAIVLNGAVFKIQVGFITSQAIVEAQGFVYYPLLEDDAS